MAELDLTTENPAFTYTGDARTQGRDLYDAGITVDKKPGDYLFQETNEHDDQYAIRKKRAVLDPWVKKIIVARQAILWRKQPTRKIAPALKEYLDDCDGLGTGADTFFAEATKDAQIDGVHWVLVDLPKTPKGGYVSAAEEKAANHRPFFNHIPGQNVLDWAVGEDRKLLWAVIAQEERDSRPEPGVAASPAQQYMVWSRADWKLYEVVAGDDSNKAKVELQAEGPNPIGEVPLVPFLGARYTDFSGWPVAFPVFRHVILIYNKSSDLDWFERLSSHPIPYVIGPEKIESIHASKGIYVKSLPGAQIQLGYLEPTGTAFASMRDSIAELQYKIFSIALAQAKKDSAQVESADAQREDRKSFTSSLKSVSVTYELAERRCWELFGKWANKDGKVEVAYNRDFDDKMIDAQMIGTLSGLVESDRMTLKTFLTLMKEGEQLPESVDVDQELKELEIAEKKRADAVLLAFDKRPNSGAGGEDQDDPNLEPEGDTGGA